MIILQYHTAVEESVSLAEITDYLHCNMDPDNPATLLGLKPADIERNHPHKKVSRNGHDGRERNFNFIMIVSVGLMLVFCVHKCYCNITNSCCKSGEYGIS